MCCFAELNCVTQVGNSYYHYTAVSSLEGNLLSLVQVSSRVNFLILLGFPVLGDHGGHDGGVQRHPVLRREHQRLQGLPPHHEGVRLAIR